MPTLPVSSESLLVRTDLTDTAAWHRLCDEVERGNDDGFRAYVVPVSDPAFGGATWRAVRAAVADPAHRAAVLFIADGITFTSPDRLIQVVDLWDGREPFRCVPAYLWSVENNLNAGNMDWAEFARAVDDGGVFRGFG